jgi:anti-sigma B factor antagonist
MELKIYEASGIILVKITGRIVLEECDYFKSSIVPLINSQVNQINLDLSQVDFIDSAGLGVLVGIKVSSNKHRSRLTLISPSRGVSDILMVSKLDAIFEIITGADADQLVSQLENPQFERQSNGVTGPHSGIGPAMPSMPLPLGGPAPVSPGGGAKDQLDQICKEAVDFMRRGDYEGAVGCYRRVINLSPDYLPAHNNLAIVFEKRPEWHQEAIQQWHRVLEISQGNNDNKHIERAQKHLANLERLGP